MSGGEAGLVLVAEDSLVVRALLRAQLGEQGYGVVEAADGVEAVERAREHRPDVILLDIEMPRLDGHAVLAELKGDSALADIPVVIVSGRTTANDAVKGLALGAHDYLRKPFEAAELSARVLAAARTKRLQDDLRRVNDELTRQACTDQLTGVANRRRLDEELGRLCAAARRHGRPLGVLLVDVDRFKRINDEHGHRTGDEALAALAARLRERLRQEDVIGRWGGEEFLVLVPDTDSAGVAALAESLRAHVAAHPLRVRGDEIPVTVSVGWTAHRGDAPEQLVLRADGALLAAKQAGRNRAVSSDDA